MDFLVTGARTGQATGCVERAHNRQITGRRIGVGRYADDLGSPAGIFLRWTIDISIAEGQNYGSETDSHLTPLLRPAESHLPMPAIETILSTLPAASEKDRLLLVLVSTPGEGSRMELRQQSFSQGVGWFTQSTVALEPDQISQLRSALGMTAASRGRSELPREMKRITTPAWQPRVVRADSA